MILIHNSLRKIVNQLIDWWDAAPQSERIYYSLLFFMQLGFYGALILAIIEKAWLSLFVVLIALVVIWLPSLLHKSIKVRIPLEFEFILNIFIYSSLFLGELQNFYIRFWWWDILLHAISGLALGFLGFLILYSLYRSGRLHAHPSIIAV